MIDIMVKSGGFRKRGPRLLFQQMHSCISRPFVRLVPTGAYMGLKVGAAFLDDAEQHTVRELFAMISARDDGLLSIPETKDVLNVLGLNSLQASSTRLPAEKQQGTNGFLSVDNALQALLGPSPALYTQFDLLNAFSLFANPEGPSGCITYKALKDALVKHSGSKMLSSDVDVLLANIALASQGSVDYQDIISKFFST